MAEATLTVDLDMGVWLHLVFTTSIELIIRCVVISICNACGIFCETGREIVLAVLRMVVAGRSTLYTTSHVARNFTVIFVNVCVFFSFRYCPNVPTPPKLNAVIIIECDGATSAHRFSRS